MSCGATAPKKGGLELLQRAIFSRAWKCGLIRPQSKPQGIVDFTGFESRHVSRYYLWRKNTGHRKRKKTRCWPKLSIACHAESHLIAGVLTGWGPSQDSPGFAPVIRQADRLIHFDRVLGDAAYDSESNHVLCREKLHIRSTVIPARKRRFRNWPKAKYRRQMKQRLHKKIYGQRWQMESTFSQMKRHLGSALTAKSWASQRRECWLRVLTHNFMLLGGARESQL